MIDPGFYFTVKVYVFSLASRPPWRPFSLGYPETDARGTRGQEVWERMDVKAGGVAGVVVSKCAEASGLPVCSLTDAHTQKHTTTRHVSRRRSIGTICYKWEGARQRYLGRDKYQMLHLARVPLSDYVNMSKVVTRPN